MSKLYYTAPEQSTFDDMKQAVTKIWESYEDPYRSEKLERIKDVQNISDNFMYLFAMLDHLNQRKAAEYMTPNTREEVRLRMVDGGNSEFEINNVFGI